MGGGGEEGGVLSRLYLFLIESSTGVGKSTTTGGICPNMNQTLML